MHESPNNGVVRQLKSRDQWSDIRNERMATSVLDVPKVIKPCNAIIDSDQLPSESDPRFGLPLQGSVQKGGRWQAEHTLQFLQAHARQYLYHISAPGESEKYCSRLSTHLAFGVLSVKEVLTALNQRLNEMHPADRKGWSRLFQHFDRGCHRDHSYPKIRGSTRN